MILNLLYVFIGGGTGSVIRFMIGLLFQRSTNNLPLATLASNVLASLIFAGVINLIQSRTEDPQSIRLLLLTGLCGGLSTFSTFGYETFLLMKQQNYLWMSLNILISVTLCLSSFFLIKKINGLQ